MSDTAKETPTEFLIRSLEDIEDAEDVVLVIRRRIDNKDDITWIANSVPLWKSLGMLQFCILDMYDDKKHEDDEDID